MRTTVRIRDIAYRLPAKRLTNDDLKQGHPDWDMERVTQRTGIETRRHAKPGELASDLAYEACLDLFRTTGVPLSDIGALVFCTVTPDYIGPHNAALLQARLGLSTRTAAFDISLGCSGFVYGLAIARGLALTMGYESVLLVTADTLSRHLHPEDRATLTVFGDGAAASLVERSPTGILDLSLGTDGRGADKVIIRAGGMREPLSGSTRTEKRDFFGNVRSDEHLYMDGSGVLEFAKAVVPGEILSLLDRNRLRVKDVDLVLLHQASRAVIESICGELGLSPGDTFCNLRDIGNTVSSSLPILLKDAEEAGRLKRGNTILLCGFGVGLSWGTCLMEW